MDYQRVTREERIHLYRWRQEGCGIREIANRLARAPSTISREVRRNQGHRGYRSKQADAKAQERARRPGRRKLTDAIVHEVEQRLQEGWTPEIISKRAAVEGRPHVCKESIYKYIYSDARSGGDLWKCLPRSHRRRRRRCPRREGRGRGIIPNQRRIDTRPAEVEKRKTVGHWEGDLINGTGKTGHLVTLVERKTRFALVGRSGSKEAPEVKGVICDLFDRLPEAARSGLTLDNGKEFALHESLARELGIDVFFAFPYHSWERGSNENVNGLIRRLHPKKTSFEQIGPAELQRIDRFLNDRPRACLDWQTPRERMAQHLMRVARE